MGKTTAAGFFKKLGVPVFSADDAVHHLFKNNVRLINKIAVEFGTQTVTNNGGRSVVNRRELSRVVMEDAAKLARLETMVHPLVRELERKFVHTHYRGRRKMVLLDIPLLFETNAESRVDYVVTVTAPLFLQKQRVLSRPGMTPQKFAWLKSRQLNDAQRRCLSDKTIPTGIGRNKTFQEVKRVVKTCCIASNGCTACDPATTTPGAAR